MKIRNVTHGGLRRVMEEDCAAGLPPATVPKLPRMLCSLQDTEREDALWTVPGWNAQRLAGDLRGVCSLTVTNNWCPAFRIDRAEGEIFDLDCEDCHQETAMGTKQGLRMKNPTHLGGFVKSEIVEATAIR